MLGLMQNQQLLISSLIEFADRHHGEGEIVSRRVEGDIHRYTYKDLAVRSRKVANGLDSLKLQFGDRVATLAWNGYRHLELYFGVSGTGRVLHTLNPRLHPEQIAWITNHAEDSVLCFDMSFLPIVKAIHSRCSTVKHFVAMCDADKLPADRARETVRPVVVCIHLTNARINPNGPRNQRRPVLRALGTHPIRSRVPPFHTHRHHIRPVAPEPGRAPRTYGIAHAVARPGL